MKKFTLTLFLALASLTTFAQSTVKTIRVANATTALGVNIPTGTIVIDLATSDVYTATAGVLSTFTITTALAESTPLFKKINGAESTAFSVTEDTAIAADAAAGATDITLLKEVYGSSSIDQFKVYVNGALLNSSAFTFTLDGDGGTPGNQSQITLLDAVYQYDVISITYSTFE